ncbi:MAG: AmmeMemoRadiSam system radical SAM enzyme [Actinomycetota bacterium]|nr:AmmeMemoRadiSam system radical SAM enzyme [Actinomycetota bacterium]
MKEALFYEKRDDNVVRCRLCPQLCLIEPDDTGFCFIRKNIGGVLYAMEYGRVSSAQLDPIEKKPLYHFHPGSTIFSIGGIGCNLRCPWCQNWSIAQPRDSAPGLAVEDALEQLTEEMAPEQVVEIAKKYAPGGCIGVAYTYNEPFIWYEYVKDIAVLVKEAGLNNVMVTNGYVLEEPLRELLPLVDAMNIDIKGFNEDFYHLLGGHFRPPLKTAEFAKKAGCHIEITNLLIPGLNDAREDIEKLVDWVADKLGKDTPLHFSRYFPSYKMIAGPTPIETLRTAEAIARRKLDFVHLGNV